MAAPNQEFLRAIAGSIGVNDINQAVLDRHQWLQECGINNLAAFDRMCVRAENRDTAAATVAGGLGYIPGFGANNIAQPAIQKLFASFNQAHGADAVAIIVGAVDRAVIPAVGSVYAGEVFKPANPSHTPQAPPKFMKIGPGAETAFNAVWNTPFGTFTRNYLLADIIGRLVGIDGTILTALRTTAGLEAAMERGYNAWRRLRENRVPAVFTATDGKVRYEQGFMRRLDGDDLKAHIRELDTTGAALFNYTKGIAVNVFSNSLKSVATAPASPRFWAIFISLLPEGALAASGALVDDPVKSIGLQALSDLVLIEGFKWRFEIEAGFEWLSAENWDHEVGVKVGEFTQSKASDGLTAAGNLLITLYTFLKECMRGLGNN